MDLLLHLGILLALLFVDENDFFLTFISAAPLYLILIILVSHDGVVRVFSLRSVDGLADYPIAVLLLGERHVYQLEVAFSSLVYSLNGFMRVTAADI